MRELSLTEIGMVSGGVQDHKGGGGGGFGGGGSMGTGIALGSAGGAFGYANSVAGGGTKFSVSDAAVATIAGGVGGMAGVPFAGSHGAATSVMVGAGVSNYITSFNAAIKSASTNNTSTDTNNTCKSGDNYNVTGKK